MSSIRATPRLSRQQQGMLLEQSRNPATSVFNQALAVRLPRSVDAGAFGRAWRAVAGRHEMLRTTFEVNEQSPTCRVHADLETDLRSHVLRGASEAELHERVKEDAQRPFDLERAPSRITIFELADADTLVLFNIHHLISDASSWRILLGDLATAYAAIRRGAEPSLAPPPERTFADFVAMEEAAITDERRRALEEFWRNELASPPQLEMPTDRPRSRSMDRCGFRRFDFDAEVTRALLALAGGGSLFRTVVALYTAFLHRYTGQRDFLAYTPATLRTPQFDEVVGAFVTDIVVRVPIAPQATFQEHLAEVSAAARRAGQHRALPFADIVRVARPLRDPTRTIMREASCLLVPDIPGEALCAAPIGTGELAGVGFPLPQQQGGNDVDLRVAASGGRLHCELHYRLDLFDDTTADRMIRHFETLVRSVAEDPGRRVAELAMLPADEKRSLVALSQRSIGAGASASAAVPCLHVAFERWARETPDAVALVEGDRELTYGEANAWANRLARRLREAGVGTESLVGLVMARSVEAFVGILAIVKAGGAYVPLDPTLPRARLQRMLEGCGARVALFAEGAGPSGLVATELRVDAASRASHEPSNLDLACTPDQAMVVVHTSGSTGEPKAVVLPHRGPIAYVTGRCRAWEMTPRDRVLQFASLSFDVSIEETLLAWVSGGGLVLRDERMLETAALFEACRRHRLTLLDLPSTYFGQIVKEVEANGGWPEPVRMVVIGGERAPTGCVTRFHSAARHPRLMNVYGPAEASNSVTCADTGAYVEAYGDQSETMLGEVCENCAIYVLDDQLELVPPGVIGELCIGGTTPLARGYLARPDTTANVFVPDPFRPGQRMYRTGDLARRRADGMVEFVGRKDDQVKIRGYRIEPAEVEVALGRHPAVDGAVALAFKSERWGARLVAYVRLKDPSAKVDLRRFAADQLPAYMVPGAIVTVPSWPTTPNGKIDRRALAALDVGQRPELVPPRNAFEEAVADIWAQILGVERVGIRDDFFELGGHSLLALELKRKLETWLEVDVPIASLLEAANVEDQTKLLIKKLEEPKDFALTEIKRLTPAPEKRYEPFPLSDMQQAYRLGRMEHFEFGGFPAQGYMEFECADLDVERLGAAFQKVVERHDMLRAVILSESEQRVVEGVGPYTIRVEDLAGRSDEEVAARIEATRFEMFHQRRGDPTTWPLFDVRVTRLSDHLIRLHVRMEMLVIDARSMQTILDDWAHYYASPDAELPPLEITYRDCIFGLREFEQHPLYLRAKEYWWKRLPTLPVAPEIPLATSIGSITGPRFRARVLELEPDEWTRLQAKGARCGLTPSAILCAAFAELLGAWNRNRDFTMTCLFYNRLPNHPDVEKVVGNFSATSLLSIEGQAGDFETRAKKIQAQLWKDLNHSQMSGVRVLRELNRLRNAGTRPTSPFVFASTLPIDKLRPQSTEAWPGRLVHRAMMTPQVLLDHQVSEEQGRLVAVWDVVEEAFPPGLIADMWQTYCALIHQLAADDGAWKTAERSLLPPSQMDARRRANATEAPLSPALLHQLVVEQAQKTPDRLAVVSGDQRLTYGELLRLATHLGARLREAGAKPNQLVGVVMEKGWEEVVAALGVQLAGAAYLPIDANLPAHRLRAVLDAGEVKLAVTQPWVDTRVAWPDALRRIVLDDSARADGKVPALPTVQSNADLAYVIFTSGSTGVPKGVMINHTGAVNTVLDINQRFGVGPDDRVLAISSLSFDLSVYDIFGPLAVGGALVIPSPAMIRDPASLLRLLDAEKVTIWNSVPALFGMLVDQAAERGEPLPPKLRLAMLSGDWIPVSLPDRARKRSQGLRIVSLGGATEASIWSVWYPIGEVPPAWTSIPYGTPLLNQTMTVLDDRMEPVPTWVPGDLYIGGVGLALGYWKDEAKTKAAFVTHPKTGERLYRTGDLARYLPDGTLEFLGRADLQVKIQGFRIELGDVEAAFHEHRSVRSCVCIAQGERTNRRLVAYVVPADENAVTADELVSFVGARLPAYMVPAKIVLVPDLPLSSNGKVDRVALSKLGDADAGKAEFVAPRTSAELRVAAIWQEVLGVPQVGVRDEFFGLGGTSLHAVRIASRIDQAFGRRLPVSSLLRGATVERVATALQSGERPARSSQLVALQTEGARPPIFFVHPIGGNVFCYAELARALGADQPFYAFQSRGLESDDPPNSTIEAMADDYLGELVALAPRGPYRLGGWSMGGLIAFEMARRLASRGERVELLALVDTPFPEARVDASPEEAALHLVRDLEGMSGKALGISAGDLGALEPDARRAKIVERARAVGALPADLPAADTERLLRVFSANASAIRAYRPGRYEGDVALLAAETSTGADAGWKDVVGGSLALRTLRGDHYTIVAQPNVAALADEIRQRAPSK